MANRSLVASLLQATARPNNMMEIAIANGFPMGSNGIDSHSTRLVLEIGLNLGRGPVTIWLDVELGYSNKPKLAAQG